MTPGWKETLICWWAELPFTRTTTEESAERSSEIQKIKIQIPAPRTGTLHITLQAASKVLRSSFAQKDQENLVYSRLNMSQCHGEFWHRLGCISKNIARKCLFPFTWHLQGCLGDSVPSFCLLCSGRTSIAEEDVWRTTGKHMVSGRTLRGSWLGQPAKEKTKRGI